MTDIRAALNLTACDVCMSVFYGSAWCHEVRTSPINWPAIPAASPEPERCAMCGNGRQNVLHYPGTDTILDDHPFQPAPAAPTAEALRDALLDLIAPPMGADIVVDGWRSGMRARLDALIAAARTDERTRLAGITHFEGDGHEDHP